MTTEITDPATAAMQSVAEMQVNAARVLDVLAQMTGRMANLPPLLEARPEATAKTARLVLQVGKESEARVWAVAFDQVVTIEEEDAGYGDYRAVRATAEFVVGGVPVRLVSYETFSPSAWAERNGAAVSA